MTDWRRLKITGAIFVPFFAVYVKYSILNAETF